MGCSKAALLRLYKDMMREALEFQSYNFRLYALRRIRDGFRANKAVTEEDNINDLIAFAKENLDIMKRQTTIGKLYATEKLLLEKKHSE